MFREILLPDMIDLPMQEIQSRRHNRTKSR
jgi:hypothetical protein